MLEAHFIDEHLLVLDKPVGELAVPGRGAQGAACLLARAQSVTGKGGTLRVNQQRLAQLARCSRSEEHTSELQSPC